MADEITTVKYDEMVPTNGEIGRTWSKCLNKEEILNATIFQINIHISINKL